MLNVLSSGDSILQVIAVISLLLGRSAHLPTTVNRSFPLSAPSVFKYSIDCILNVTLVYFVDLTRILSPFEGLFE